jgi:hypothetical protein
VHRLKYTSDLSFYANDILTKHKPYLKTLVFKDIRPESRIERFSIGDFVTKALSFLTYVELNNPVVLFKCDQKYLFDRLFLYSSIEEEEKHTREVAEQERRRKLNPAKEEFLKMMQQKDPLFPNEIKQHEEEQKAKLDKEKELHDRIYSKEVIEYADTLTTWVINIFLKNIVFKIEIRRSLEAIAFIVSLN